MDSGREEPEALGAGRLGGNAMMTGQRPGALARARGGVGRRLKHVRDALEWKAAQALWDRGPWCRNRWGHLYQAISLSEYHYIRDGNPETHEARLLERLLRPGMTVVDVGANHGLFSLEAAHFVGPHGRIHAFEPAPRTRERFTENVRVNGLDGLVRIFPHALGEHPGSARLRVHHELSGLNSLAQEDIVWNRSRLVADELVSVPVVTLDDHAEAAGLNWIDFLKIDVEGFELAVLRGAKWLLAGQRIRWLMIEVGDVTCANARVDPARILDELAAHDYGLHAIEPDGSIGRRVEAFPDGPFAANFLAFPTKEGADRR
jgi:FkbM family methyltransferase